LDKARNVKLVLYAFEQAGLKSISIKVNYSALEKLMRIYALH
jgi:Tfp pilus assembly PilM family ATPase